MVKIKLNVKIAKNEPEQGQSQKIGHKNKNVVESVAKTEDCRSVLKRDQFGADEVGDWSDGNAGIVSCLEVKGG